MSKKTIQPIILFSLIAIATIPIINPYLQVTAQNSGSVNFLTYTNHQFGYSIQYPSNWQVNENYDPVNLKSIVIGNMERTVAFFITVNDSIGPKTTLEDIANKANQSLSGRQKFTIDKTNYDIVGYPAIRTEGTFDSHNPITGETQDRAVTLITIINGKSYELSMFAPNATFSDYSPIFGQMIYSLKPA